MKPHASHIRDITVVSNTHWDREFRRSFEKTRRDLLTMFDTLLDILEKDPDYHSFTLDAHTVLVEDYLEMRPERRETVGRLLREGRLLAGPWYTLPEVLSIGDEALARNFLYAQKTLAQFDAKPMPVGYTPASWGQTGQLPQVMANFGVRHLMFYRGISHHESDAEFIWEAPDGTRTPASRFALYARYNWYYLVHRVVTQDHAFDKRYSWTERDETPMRICDRLAGDDVAFHLLDPELRYDKSRLRHAIEAMVNAEGPHFTTPHFLAMHGHDVSVPHPLETQIIRDANLVQDHLPVTHGNLMDYWAKVEKDLDLDALPVLRGERRSALKKGMWTYLLPGSVSARTYLKQIDFDTHKRLVWIAEPLACLAASSGAPAPDRYLDRGWKFLLANHTHDANGGCAPDRVCQDMEFRYRQAQDLADIVAEDAMGHIVRNLDPGPADAPAWRLVAFNPLPQTRRELVEVELEVPAALKARSLILRDPEGRERPYQIRDVAPSGVFVDSIWDVPTNDDTTRFQVLVDLDELPPVGYTVLTVEPRTETDRRLGSLVTANNTIENEFLRLQVNGDGTADLLHKETEMWFGGLNAFRDQGEAGNAWFHDDPQFDEIISSDEGAAAQIAIIEDGPLSATIRAVVPLLVPRECPDGKRRSPERVRLDIETEYTLKKGDPVLTIRTTLDNQALDHWLRAIFPTGLETGHSHADSHFDVVTRSIAVPDSSTWVEKAVGTHPLRTMVDLNDGRVGLSLFTQGLFEYEVLRQENNPVALSLLRGCRIRLMVSEEKKQELPDLGVQCLGRQEFHYALYPHAGTWDEAGSLLQARRWATPVRCAQAGKGHGTLPWAGSLFTVSRNDVVVTAVKPAEDGRGIIVRLFNPSLETRAARIDWHQPPKSAWLARMDETETEALKTDARSIPVQLAPKKIVTVRVVE